MLLVVVHDLVDLIIAEGCLLTFQVQHLDGVEVPDMVVLHALQQRLEEDLDPCLRVFVLGVKVGLQGHAANEVHKLDIREVEVLVPVGNIVDDGHLREEELPLQLT